MGRLGCGHAHGSELGLTHLRALRVSSQRRLQALRQQRDERRELVRVRRRRPPWPIRARSGDGGIIQLCVGRRRGGCGLRCGKRRACERRSPPSALRCPCTHTTCVWPQPQNVHAHPHAHTLWGQRWWALLQRRALGGFERRVSYTSAGWLRRCTAVHSTNVPGACLCRVGQRTAW